MNRYIWKGAITAALACAGAAGTRAAAAPHAANAKAADAKADENIIILKQDGKPERKCTIVSTTRRPDGTVMHKVKALDNGEEMTIFEAAPGSNKPPKPDVAADATVPSAQNPPAARPPANPTRSKSSAFAASADTSPLPPPAKPVPAMNTLGTGVTPTPVDPPAARKGGLLGGSRPGLFSRLFGRSRSDSTPAPARTTVPGPIPTVAPPLADPLSPLPRTQSSLKPATPTAVATPAAPVLNPVVIEPQVLPAFPVPTAAPVAPATVDPLTTLKDALQPSERQAAAQALVEGPEGRSPEVRAALLTAVQEDPAPVVRAGCLRCLAKQGIRDSVFQRALSAAQQDRDPRVRDEARTLK